MNDSKKQSDSVTPSKFLACLKKSGLLTGEQFSAIVNQFHSRQNDYTTHQLIEYLVKAKLLSQWQCKQLSLGKHKGFFLGSYIISDVLGAGGMSAVYLAEHQLTGQRRAIKVLPKTKMTQSSYLSRFYREARTVASLNHPNIIRIYDIAKEDDQHFMVMEYVRGTDLHARFKLPTSGICNSDFGLCHLCIEQAAAGLQHAHEHNVVHRDVKPGNLLLTDDRQIKVLDLGLALLKTEDDRFSLSEHHNETLMGTVDYLAPEQAINSHNLDHRADIYSLGCTLYYLLTGTAPFNSGTIAQRIAAHQNLAPTPILDRRPDCPHYLARICERMMAKSPDDRFQSCDQIFSALDCRSTDATTISLNPTSTELEAGPPPKKSIPYLKSKRKRRLPLILLLTSLSLIVIILAILVFNR